MKKITVCLMLTCLSLSFYPFQSNAANEIPVSGVDVPTVPATAGITTLELRLNEINAMDKSEMNAAERKSLRKEVRSIKHDLKKAGSNGIYLSVGAIIIVILLLILLL